MLLWPALLPCPGSKVQVASSPSFQCISQGVLSACPWSCLGSWLQGFLGHGAYLGQEGTASSCAKGGSGWELGKTSQDEQSGTGTGCPGSGGVTALGVLEESLDPFHQELPQIWWSCFWPVTVSLSSEEESSSGDWAGLWGNELSVPLGLISFRCNFLCSFVRD